MECTSPENSFQSIICHCIWNAQGKDAKSFVCTSDPTLTSVLLLSSIPLRYWRAYHFSLYCADMEVKQINKRASGQAFELILKPPSPVSEAPRTLASPKKKELSLEEIQKKLEAAEERRKVSFLKKMLVIRPDLVYRITAKFPLPPLTHSGLHGQKLLTCLNEQMSLFSFSSLQTNLTGFDAWEVCVTKYR